MEDFKILTNAANQELGIRESILIKMKQPALNNDTSSFPLNIFFFSFSLFLPIVLSLSLSFIFCYLII